MKNKEGYPDPTAGKAIGRADRPPEEVVNFRRALKSMCTIYRVRVLGKLTLDEKIYVRCGCFFGELSEFRKKVKETHGESRLALGYQKVADLAEWQLNIKTL